MALFARAFAIFPLAALLLSIFVVDAQLAPLSAPTTLSFVSSSPAVAPSPSQEVQIEVQLQSLSQLSEDLPNDIKEQMTKAIEGNMQMTMHKIDEFGQTLKKRLDDPEATSYTKECIQQCDEVYEAAKDDVKNSLQDIQDGDLFKANFDINAISTNIDTCEQCFQDMVGDDPELTKFDAWVRGITGDCLGALDKILT